MKEEGIADLEMDPEVATGLRKEANSISKQFFFKKK